MLGRATEMPPLAEPDAFEDDNGHFAEACLNAAFVHGITQGTAPLGRPLTRKDLKAPSAYNTYTIKGLPPGPIANPGRAALAAVLNPAETEYLYFVADGSGGHAFAKTLQEHNRNVAKWRKIQRQQRQQQDNSG